MFYSFTENLSVHQRVIEKCRNKLVTDMSVIHIATRLHKDGKIREKCLKEIKVSIYLSISTFVNQYTYQFQLNAVLLFRAKRPRG